MAASITEITRIQRLIEKFQRMADTEPAVHHLLQQINKEYGGSHFLSLEALRGLDTERQQALAELLTDLSDKIFLSQAFTQDEETKLQAIIREANSKQQQVNLKRSEEKQAGLSLIESGRCALISLEAFNALDLGRQERLAILVGRECLQQRLSATDERAMKNLVQLVQLRQETTAIRLNVSPSFFPGTPSILPSSSADAQKSPRGSP